MHLEINSKIQCQVCFDCQQEEQDDCNILQQLFEICEKLGIVAFLGKSDISTIYN